MDNGILKFVMTLNAMDTANLVMKPAAVRVCIPGIKFQVLLACFASKLITLETRVRLLMCTVTNAKPTVKIVCCYSLICIHFVLLGHTSTDTYIRGAPDLCHNKKEFYVETQANGSKYWVNKQKVDTVTVGSTVGSTAVVSTAVAASST